jgi:hypothetical protein
MKEKFIEKLQARPDLLSEVSVNPRDFSRGGVS